MEGLLEDAGTTFLLITSPRGDAVDDVVYFRRRLRESGMPFGAAIVNRVHEGAATAVTGSDVSGDLAALLGDELGTKVASNFDDYRELAHRDAGNVGRLERELRGDPLVRVPLLDEDVHDLGGLAEVNGYLFASDAVAA